MEPSAAAMFGSYDTVGREGGSEGEREEREREIGKDLLLRKFYLVTVATATTSNDWNLRFPLIKTDTPF